MFALSAATCAWTRVNAQSQKLSEIPAPAERDRETQTVRRAL